jgi:hypothetical protein
MNQSDHDKDVMNKTKSIVCDATGEALASLLLKIQQNHHPASLRQDTQHQAFVLLGWGIVVK